MKKLLIFILLIFNINYSFARNNFDITKYDYKFCNNHIFRYMFYKVYNVNLCINEKNNLAPKKIFNSNFSIIINYNLSFNKEKLAQSSIKEINRYYNLDSDQQKSYYKKLVNIFPDVQKHDIIEAKYNNQGITKFYHNNSFIGKIDDKKFSEIFLNIWLHENNKYKSLTKDLFNNEN